jgi:acyl-CoA thioester hydrolase
LVNNLTQVRVIYADTDAMGIVYHTNYIRWFELGRNELMRQLGLQYSNIENYGYYLPLTTVHCHYHQPAKYDQLLIIETQIDYIKRATVKFNSNIWDEHMKNRLVEGYTIHACTNNEGKVRRIPQMILDLKNKYNIKGE